MARSESSNATSLADRVERVRFLGREFLTWIWFESETHGGLVTTEGVGDVGVEFTQRLTLDSAGNVREVNSVKAEDPTAAEESRVALRMGKKVGEVRIIVRSGERDFALGLHGETLQLKGVRLPTVLATEDAEKLAERLELLDEVEGLVDSLYARFVRLRMDEESWGPVREKMRAWVAKGLS